MLQISFATDCTRIRLLDYALCIILIEAANGFARICWRLGRLDHVYVSNLIATEVTLIWLFDYALHNTNRRRNWLKLEVHMFMIWIARMTKKT